MIDIFSETEEFYSVIHEINVLAFGQENEARLVENLRKSRSFDFQLSLVAVKEGRVVGHILFSPVTISSLLKKAFSSGCSKMPRCKALEILRSEAYLGVRRNKPAPCLTRGRMRETQQIGVFQQPVKTEREAVPAVALAPMAVRPEFQNQGIGSRLVREGLEQCRKLGHKIVVVVGHPNYYPRFGFASARAKGLEAPFPVPDEAFMVKELEGGALDGTVGMVEYPPEFDGV
jgi:predicted N-acetyltransferase YhbS